jgi:hypothetical protein
MKDASTKPAPQVGTPPTAKHDGARENSRVFAEWAARLERKVERQLRKQRAQRRAARKSENVIASAPGRLQPPGANKRR